MAEPNENNPGKNEEWYVKLITQLIARFGFPKAAVIILALMLWCWGTDAQHQFFIDRYFLLKNSTDGSAPSFYVYVIYLGLIILVVIQHFVCKHKLSAMNKRIEEISAEKNKLQNTLNTRTFRSSNKGNKS